MEEIVKLQKILTESREEIVILKKFVGKNSIGGVAHIKIKEPNSYDGMRSAKTLGNFLWDMEQCLERLGLTSEETKVKLAAQFLMEDTKLWWRQRVDQVAHGDIEDISTWEELKEALLAHFSLQDETWDARTKIKYIKQTRILQAYQWEFASVILELPDMAEKDKVTWQRKTRCLTSLLG